MGIALGLLACGCVNDADAILIDPDAFGNDQGTLISISDVRTVASDMVQSMLRSDRLANMRARTRPLRISIGNFKQRTSITIFDKQVFLNRLLEEMSGADTDGNYTFLRRGPGIPGAPGDAAAVGVGEERQLQETGDKASRAESVPGLEGGELVLSGELREILSRAPTPAGGERETRTVQYTLAIDQVSDASHVWFHTYEIVKEQVTGAVYQ